MASKPWFSASRGRWLMKYRPDPTGPWKIQPLGKHPEPFPPSRPPKKPPQVILDRAHEFEEIEYRAKHNLGAAPARLKGLEVYLHAYVEAYEGTRRKGSPPSRASRAPSAVTIWRRASNRSPMVRSGPSAAT
jgi:hypothetical protein